MTQKKSTFSKNPSKAPSKPRVKPGISSKIEKERELDVEDRDIISHVNQFLTSLHNIPKLEKISLLSREEALDGLEQISKVSTVLSQKAKTIAALKQLLIQRKMHGDS